MSAPPAGWIVPDWPAPARVRTLITTREGGVSEGPYASLNLGLRSGDDPGRIARNRRLLEAYLPAPPIWLKQVHGARVASACERAGEPEADASTARQPGRVCAVLTADCLPLLLCDRDGTTVGIAHCGWRGIAAGVIEATVSAMGCPASQLVAYLGPAIGPAVYEVGAELREIFASHHAADAAAFRPGKPGKYFADLYALVRRRLARLGLTEVHGGGFCTYSEPRRFFSFRRDGAASGRMASLIWLEGN
jgi:purine-nucleoside/S-methyl-5'-thioadenosine phosphorylase / adenosine deaminase